MKIKCFTMGFKSSVTARTRAGSLPRQHQQRHQRPAFRSVFKDVHGHCGPKMCVASKNWFASENPVPGRFTQMEVRSAQGTRCGFPLHRGPSWSVPDGPKEMAPGTCLVSPTNTSSFEWIFVPMFSFEGLRVTKCSSLP